MITRTRQVCSFAILGDGKKAVFDIFSKAFSHPWVASYQIGFGPPLVKSSDRLNARLAEARTALEKLDAYLDVCLLNDEERRRLSSLHRKLVVRRHGPVEAEALDAACADALDLSIRLHIPAGAPERAAASMREAGIDFSLIEADTPPEVMSGRFLVRLSDPTNQRILDIGEVRARLSHPDNAVAVELRVPVTLRNYYGQWLSQLQRDTGLPFVDLEEPAAHARVSRDGQRT